MRRPLNEYKIIVVLFIVYGESQEINRNYLLVSEDKKDNLTYHWFEPHTSSVIEK